MTALDPSSPVAVVGTGTMGQGIAQVALVAGHPVRLYDAVDGRAREAADAIGARLDRLVEKDRLTGAERDAARARLVPAGTLGELADCALVVEAVVERLDVKQELFRALEDVVGDDCLLATNTSSLSVTAVGGALRVPGRFVGLHFFNPAPLLPLVEVVSGFATDPASATRAYETARAWGKTPVACADTPGFVVNRVARPFYAEALAAYEARAADPATVDAVLRESGGFRMGAFELTDLIGQDVNESVTHSVWQSFFQDVRFTPSLAQRRLVESGRLGRKSGQGWYDYRDGADRPAPHTAEPAGAPAHVVVEGDLGPAAELVALIREAGIEVRPEDGYGAGRLVLPDGGTLSLTDGQLPVSKDLVHFDLALDYRAAARIALSASRGVRPGLLSEATGLFQALGKKVSVIGDIPGMIVARTVARIIDLAFDAVAKGVAAPEDVDTAMRLGVNYPLGPFEWSRRLGDTWAYYLLADVHEWEPSGRCAPSLALHRHAEAAEDREGAAS
ncbi:3-hydroxyacyl-CoA dehydrogenase [Streptomyces anthocyanicus]|uniref:3-hydroxyacyl-CoA dehydrogenase n=1 Tax=Streptomyces TaxID=1883 RepID=UPI0029AD9E86|nr:MULTISPECIES: 3-hydroxyacyl-CoA dehydrogenase [unclassified Streptomyces]MDX3365521.1 3-hydroxyacyl-CoA dehydrogenase [Streptomyces sp. ME02-6987-2C]MDX3401354.1 3-hydroxyacyl-CoA dehydrogenase [Streptomyces sp. ME01-18h]MDX3425328.1 3-hydroxyacyl-CoA dehydrogenase [Streptomyces sp. ME02-6985-2c]